MKNVREIVRGQDFTSLEFISKNYTGEIQFINDQFKFTEDIIDKDGNLVSGAFVPIDHNTLINRDVINTHPISAITDLTEELASKEPIVDSTTDNMLVYEWDGTNWIDHSIDAADPNINFTLANGNIGTSVYFSSDALDNVGQYTKHYGLEMNVPSLGASDEFVITGGTEADGGYNNRGGDYNEQPVFIRTTLDYWIFNIQGYWVLHNLPPEQTTNYYEARYLSLTLEGDYTAMNSAIGTPTVVSNGIPTTAYFKAEYYNGDSSTWEELSYMTTDKNPPYLSYGSNLFFKIGEFNVRYNYLLGSVIWSSTDPMGLGRDLYWTRFTIVQTAPILTIKQVKLHKNIFKRRDINWGEYYGKARPIGTFPWFFNLAVASTKSPLNADSFISETLHRGGKENSFEVGVLDESGFSAVLPLDVDTSTPISLAFSYSFAGGTVGDVLMEIHWGFITEGDNIYTDTVGAPIIGANEQITSFTLPHQTETVLNWKKVYLDISSLRSARRDGFPDTLFITIIRNGDIDTYDGNLNILDLTARYIKWNEGGYY